MTRTSVSKLSQWNMFELENARNMTADELAKTFVPTEDFKRLLSPKNHVVLGSRGSGKTAIVKMLSHDHLSKFNDPIAIKALNKQYLIGTYFPASVEWAGAMKNKPWKNEREEEEFFLWKVNVASCIALLATVRSCISYYILADVDRVMAERDIVGAISSMWTNGTFQCFSLVDLEKFLVDLEYRKRIETARCSILNSCLSKEVGYYFYIDVFAPFKGAVKIIKDRLNLPDKSTWMICIDEAEFLEESHHAILNTCMRSDSGDIVFKITTMPYYHKTLKTNVGAPLNEGDDFSYIQIDEDSVEWTYNKQSKGYMFAASLFNRRAAAVYNSQKLTFTKLLGESQLLYGEKQKKKDFDGCLELIEKYCDTKTIARAKSIYASDVNLFDDSIYRKLYGTLKLRHQIELAKGRSELTSYSGYQMLLRCADGNPRKLIRLFNSMLKLTNRSIIESNTSPMVKPNKQNRVLTEFSTNFIDVLKSDTDAGPGLYDFISTIGEYFYTRFAKSKISTNVCNSISINDKTSDKYWQYIKHAVAWGYLHPNYNPKQPHRIPYKSGNYRLSYSLAPFFKLFPRRGGNVPLSTIISWRPELDQASLLDFLE